MSTWHINSSLEAWEPVAGTIEKELSDHGFSNKFITSLLLATDEVMANIVSYAYKASPGPVIIESRYDATHTVRTATITFIDHGEAFNPCRDANKPSIIQSTTKPTTPGGFGIFLAKKQVDSLTYAYTNHANHLTLIKAETI